MATTQFTDPHFEDDEAEEEVSHVEEVFREVISGDKRGSVRRIILYVALVTAIGIEFAIGGPLVTAAAVVGGLIATILLIATDQLL